MQSNVKDHLFRIPVRLETTDGKTLDLSVITPRALLKLYELVNREELFLDVEALDGERFIIAKTAIKLIRYRTKAPAAKDLGDMAQDQGGFDPYRILKVTKEQDAEAVHQAYLVQVREYHPDRFASANLPAEVDEYMTTMLRRINAAYDMLKVAA
jgi:hypothetical protein